MKKTLSVAMQVLRLAFRTGTGWGLLAFVSALSLLMFTFARSDGSIVNELQIRLRYGLYFSTGFLHMALMYMGCVSLCKDIEGRQFHTLAAAPVHRAQIWFGKYIGLVVLGLAGAVCALLTVALCSGVLIKSRAQDSDRDELRKSLLRAHYACRPMREPLHDTVEREYKRLEIQGDLPAGKQAWEVKKELFDTLRRGEQLIAPGLSRQWTFQWRSGRARGTHVVLRTKFYAQQRDGVVRGTWRLTAADGTGGWSREFEGYPYQFHDLDIPLADVPDSEHLLLTFEGKDTPHLIFPLDNGVRLFYDNGGILGNACRWLFAQTLHSAVLIAVALALASLFTYSVAVFVNLVLYGVGVCSSFFLNVIRDLAFEEHVLFRTASLYVLRVGVWLTRGMKAPPVTDLFSEGTSIPLLHLLVTWGPGLLAYTLLVMVLGIVVLTVKELDKILH